MHELNTQRTSEFISKGGENKMIKQLAAVGVGAAMFLATAVPVFADTTINNTGATVVNDVTTSADTGFNEINSLFDGLFSNSITTGKAEAGSKVTNDVNHNTVKNPCECKGDLIINNDDAVVVNTVNTTANTGNNEINSGGDPEEDPLNSILTGPAISGAVVSNFVNTNVVGL